MDQHSYLLDKNKMSDQEQHTGTFHYLKRLEDVETEIKSHMPIHDHPLVEDLETNYAEFKCCPTCQSTVNSCVIIPFMFMMKCLFSCCGSWVYICHDCKNMCCYHEITPGDENDNTEHKSATRSDYCHSAFTLPFKALLIGIINFFKAIFACIGYGCCCVTCSIGYGCEHFCEGLKKCCICVFNFPKELYLWCRKIEDRENVV